MENAELDVIEKGLSFQASGGSSIAALAALATLRDHLTALTGELAQRTRERDEQIEYLKSGATDIAALQGQLAAMQERITTMLALGNESEALLYVRTLRVEALEKALRKYADSANWKCARCGRSDSTLNCFMSKWTGPVNEKSGHAWNIARDTLAAPETAERPPLESAMAAFHRTVGRNAGLAAELARATKERNEAQYDRTYVGDSLEAWKENALDNSARVAQLETALDRVMIGGNHLASALIGMCGDKLPPYTASIKESRGAFTNMDLHDAWVCWRTIMQVRDEIASATLSATADRSRPASNPSPTVQVPLSGDGDDWSIVMPSAPAEPTPHAPDCDCPGCKQAPFPATAYMDGRAAHPSMYLSHNPYRNKHGEDDAEYQWEQGWKDAHWQKLKSAPAEPQPDYREVELAPLPEAKAERIEYRVLWWEMIGGQHMDFSGKVWRGFDVALSEAAMKRGGFNYHGVHIEARPASDEPWPRPFDEVATETAGTDDDLIPDAVVAAVREHLGPRAADISEEQWASIQQDPRAIEQKVADAANRIMESRLGELDGYGTPTRLEDLVREQPAPAPLNPSERAEVISALEPFAVVGRILLRAGYADPESAPPNQDGLNCMRAAAIHAKLTATDQLRDATKEVAHSMISMAPDRTVAKSATVAKWPVLNRERGELIDKKVDGTITKAEAVCLGKLQAFADAYIDLVAPRDTSQLDELESRLGLAEEPSAEEMLDWLAEQVIDVIYLDDGRLIDVKGDCPRKAIRTAMKEATDAGK